MDNNIVEKMKKSDTWDNIVEKMKKSDTWDAIGKDLGPYLDEVLGRMKAFDESIVKDFYILEFRILPVVKVQFVKTASELCDRIDELVTAYGDVMTDILKLLRRSEKLNDVLEAHTRLLVEYWKEQHAIETTGDENLMVEEELTKCDELCNIKAELDEAELRRMDAFQLRRWIHRIRKWLIGHTKFSQVSSEIRDEHKKWVEGMRAEDNSCSSTRANFQLRAPSDLHDEGMRAEDNSCSSTQVIFPVQSPSDLHDEGMRWLRTIVAVQLRQKRDYKSLVCSQVNVTKPQASLAADASKTEVKRKMSGFSSIKQLCSKFHQITNHAQDTSLHADSISLIQEGTTKLLYYVAPQVVECINTVKISQVHVAASECLLEITKLSLLEITKLYRTHITVQSEEVSFIGVIHLCEVEKNETAKSSLRKCIKTLESLKRENISTD